MKKTLKILEIAIIILLTTTIIMPIKVIGNEDENINKDAIVTMTRKITNNEIVVEPTEKMATIKEYMNTSSSNSEDQEEQMQYAILGLE